MHLKLRVWHLAVAAALAMPPAASAEPPLFQPDGSPFLREGSFYGTAGVLGGGAGFPGYASGTLIETATLDAIGPVFGFDDLDMSTVGGFFRIGYVFPNGALPAALGRRARIELGFGYSSAWGSDGSSFGPGSLGGNAPSLNSLDAMTTVSSFGPAPSGTAQVDVDNNSFLIGVRFASNYALGSRLVLSPALVLSGGRAKTSLDLDRAVSVGAPAPATFLGFEKHDLTTWQLGMNVGATLYFSLTQKFLLFAGGRLGFAWKETDYDANDCQDSVASGAACVGNGPSGYRTSVADDGSRVAFIAGFHAGAGYDMGWAVVTIGVIGTYDSAIPGIRRAELSRDTAQSAQIRYGSSFDVVGFLALTVPFGPR